MNYANLFRTIVSIIVVVSTAGLASQGTVLYDTYNNSVTNGDAEDDLDGWNVSANVTIAFDSAGGGEKSFELNPEPGVHSYIRTPLISARAGDLYQFSYAFKSVSGSIIDPGTAFALIRFYDSQDDVISQDMHELSDTLGQWHSFEHETVLPPSTAALDVVFIMGLWGIEHENDGQFRVDNIGVHRYIPKLNHGIGMPDTLYTINRNRLNDAQFVALQTMQGVLAQDTPQIYIRSQQTTYLTDMVDRHNVTRVDQSQFNWFVNHFQGALGEYVLYDIDEPASLSAATSLAGVLNAVAVDVSLKTTFDFFGYTQIMDARGKDDQWVYENYYPILNQDAIVIHTNDPSYHPAAYFLRDWAPAIRAMDWWNSSAAQTEALFDALEKSSPVYGWDSPVSSAQGDEIQFIQYHSQHDLYQIPSDWIINLSTYAGFASRSEPWQLTRPGRDNEYTQETDVHYVTFMMSDMDNICVHLAPNNWTGNTSFYASSHRGSFPVGWGMPPNMMELAPTVAQWWYRNATEKDSFTAYGPGLGYFYPHHFSTGALQKHVQKFDHLMQQADLNSLLIMDNFWPQDMTVENYQQYAEPYAALEQVRGMFYLDVAGDYARYGGRLLWFDGKPFLTCRFTLWDAQQYEGVSRTPDQLAASINALPADPGSEDGYTLVIVHAWSYGLDGVAQTIEQLDPHVRVVTPDEMIEQLNMNLQTCTLDLQADFTGNCKVDIEDLVMFMSQWLHSGLYPTTE